MNDEPTPEGPAPAPARRRPYLVGGALLAAGAALGVWAVTAATGDDARSSTDPSAFSATPSPATSSGAAAPGTPEPERPGGETESTTSAAAPAESDAGHPADDHPVVRTFAAPATVMCEDDRAASADLSFAWSIDGAERVWFGIDTSDAAAQPFAEVPADVDGYADAVYECRYPERLYTLTAVSSSGAKQSASVTVVRELP